MRKQLSTLMETIALGRQYVYISASNPRKDMKPTFGTCPACGSEKLLRSRRKGLKERLMKLFSKDLRFYRCLQCYARFKSKDETGIPIRID
jgi:DNA-directed RNA polymerase subunit RPC12/RpoP